MKTLLFIFLSVTFSFVNLFAQDEYVNDENLIRNHDHVYIDAITTIQFSVLGVPYSQPLLNIGNGSTLELTFDDMSEEAYDYTYEIVHCNADWKPSELSEMEYLDGFNNEYIRQYEFSRNTLTSYINYSLTIPNQNVKITKSGNYLLHVFEDGDKELPVLTRRFMVAENMMQVIPRIARTGKVGQARTHQEIDFSILHKGINIANPYTEVKVAILQNGRWDNAITDLKPLFIKEEQLIYDHQGKVVFPGGKEYRNINIQSLQYRSARVQRIIEDKIDKYHVQLFSDLDRSTQAYIYINDLNGQFIIENDDQNVVDRIGADYAWVHFSIIADTEFEEGDLYLFGKMTDWQIKEKFKLKYNAQQRVYTGKVFLKQGYYDYTYAYVEGFRRTT